MKTRKGTVDADADALRYAGVLGHSVAVVTDLGDGRRWVQMETCDKHSALFAARTEYAAINPAVYVRGRRGWKRVRR